MSLLPHRTKKVYSLFVDLSTCDSIALYLNKDVPYGLGGYRQAAAVFDMTKDMIGAL